MLILVHVMINLKVKIVKLLMIILKDVRVLILKVNMKFN